MSKSVTASGSKHNITGIALIINCSMALFFVLLSWWLGGNEYKDIIFGNYAIAIFLVGIAAGMAIRRAYPRRRPAEV